MRALGAMGSTLLTFSSVASSKSFSATVPQYHLASRLSLVIVLCACLVVSRPRVSRNASQRLHRHRSANKRTRSRGKEMQMGVVEARRSKRLIAIRLRPTSTAMITAADDKLKGGLTMDTTIPSRQLLAVQALPRCARTDPHRSRSS
ncbi:hypothetical protein BD309DRAFT_969216 [Dichomitus squalens]|nr:hypothetical protein BD309DRAFT_969216 [Dichomitus squalens]